MAELGPGDSLGIGLAAILSGAQRYYGLDVVEYSERARDLAVLDELARLYRQQSALPGEAEFPEVRPLLECYDFPEFLTGAELQTHSAPERVEQIRSALNGSGAASGIAVGYRAPWSDPSILPEESADLIFSQAVMEHVDDLRSTYAAMHRWLRPGGAISHQIDFRSHSTATTWNGHWTISPRLWRAVRGARPYLINRAPCSSHLQLISELGFKIITEQRYRLPTEISRADLAEPFAEISDEDLETCGVFIQAVKR